MAADKKASIHWEGAGKRGKGLISTETGALKDYPYGFGSRFEDERSGTNPEEILGAAHAACFTMAFAFAAEAEGIAVKTVRIWDDVASAPLERIQDRRGIAGDVFVIKIAGAATATLKTLDEAYAVTARARDNTRSIGVAVSAGRRGLATPTSAPISASGLGMMLYESHKVMTERPLRSRIHGDLPDSATSPICQPYRARRSGRSVTARSNGWLWA